MLIYGVCESDITKHNEDKAEKFLKSLLSTCCKDIAENYFINKKENRCNLSDWLNNYESYNGCNGLFACLEKIIRELEDVDISCDNPNGICYLGLQANTPWNYNEKTKNLTAREYRDILMKYLHYFTDDKIEIRWWKVNDECDY